MADLLVCPRCGGDASAVFFPWCRDCVASVLLAKMRQLDLDAMAVLERTTNAPKEAETKCGPAHVRCGGLGSCGEGPKGF